MVPAILAKNKVVAGFNHGDAFSKLSEVEKDQDLISGFVDYEHLKFITDDQTIYLKEIIILRHAQSNNQENDSITPYGHLQALYTAKFLNELNLQGFVGFCSPYIRCVETSFIIQDICCLPFNLHPSLSKQTPQENKNEFQDRITKLLDILPEKSVLITHTDFIENLLILTKVLSETLKCISNCSITYICRNRLIWLAKEIYAKKD